MAYLMHYPSICSELLKNLQNISSGQLVSGPSSEHGTSKTLSIRQCVVQFHFFTMHKSACEIPVKYASHVSPCLIAWSNILESHGVVTRLSLLTKRSHTSITSRTQEPISSYSNLMRFTVTSSCRAANITGSLTWPD
jgi:hypothetical protein